MYRQKIGDILYPAFLLVLSGLIAMKTRAFPSLAQGETIMGDPGPQLFPWLIALALAGLAITMIAIVIRDLVMRRRNSDKSGSMDAAPQRYRKYVVPAITFLLLAAYGLIMPRIGFSVSTIGFLCISMMVLAAKELKNRPTILVSILLTALFATFGIYSVFHYFAKVPLPTGTLWIGR